MQYRLVSPDDPQDRYRFEAQLGTSYYMVTPSVPIKSKAIVCEGAKKAIVACAGSGLTQEVTFFAIPSKEDWHGSGILEAVKPCERVFILLDPDCWKPPHNAKSNWKSAPVAFAEAVGKTARIVDMPDKVDDSMLRMGLSADEFQSCLSYARRL